MYERSPLRFVVPVAVILVLALVIGLGSIRIVEEGETCAVTTFGKLSGEASAGFHMRFPLTQRYNCFSSRIKGYETSANPESSGADYTDYAVEAQTSDGQQISINYSVTFMVPSQNAMTIFRDTARNDKELVERVVKIQSRSITRLSAQSFEASQLYSGDITAFESSVRDQLVEIFADYGVVLDDFALRKIDFDPDFILAIEQQQIARENIETAEFQAQQAEFDADKAAIAAEGLARAEIEIAKGDAQANIERARGEAEAVRLLAEAEADAIELRGAAIARNPLVLQLNFIEQLDNVQWGILPGDSIMPFLPITPAGPPVPN